MRDFGDMFLDTKNFNADISGCHVSGARYLNRMFHNSNFNRNINTWDGSKVEDFIGKFDNAIYFNQPLNTRVMQSAVNLEGMFAKAINFNQDISSWDVSNLEIMTNMFRNANCFSVDLSEWNVNKINGIPEDFNLNANKFNAPKWQKPNNYLLVAGVGFWGTFTRVHIEIMDPQESWVFWPKASEILQGSVSKFFCHEEFEFHFEGRV